MVVLSGTQTMMYLVIRACPSPLDCRAATRRTLSVELLPTFTSCHLQTTSSVLSRPRWVVVVPLHCQTHLAAAL